MSINTLVELLKQQNRDPEGIALVEKTYLFALEAHTGQFRISGDPFIEHPLGVAIIVTELELDITSIVAAILHDVLEDTEIEKEELVANFGKDVALLVEGVTKLSKIEFETREQEQVENLRKMFIAMAEDIRVIIIKLADRLHNMRTLKYLTLEKQIHKAQETLDIYAPLAHRLGMSKIKWELEDLSFRYLEPEMYKELARKVAAGRRDRESDISSAIETLRARLQNNNVEAEIFGRPKHLYSIFQKMLRLDKNFNEIYDLMALRVLVTTVRACYEVLGVVHEIWKPIPGRFKDYIAVPKSNLYQSLHTTVIGPRGTPLEIQIRTWDMHKTAEYGIAAHWKYKENKSVQDEYERKLSWLRQLLEWQKDLQDDHEFMNSLKVDLFADEVFVFTPRGDVISLPRGSTPIDFAYSIHTEIGDKCVGAKINGRLMTLEYQLDNGDIVDILTSKTSAGPSHDWLKIARTSRAKNKIRRHIKRQRQQEIVAMGKEAFEKELKRKHIKLRESEKDKLLVEEAQYHNFTDKEELLAAIGYGTLPVSLLVTRLTKKEEDESILWQRMEKEAPPPVDDDYQGGVQVMGMNDLFVRLSRCCNPLPGDDIIGYITRGRGVSIHRKDCPNVRHLLKDVGRTVPARWTSGQQDAYRVELVLRALNRAGLLHEITTVISNEKLNIYAASVKTARDHTARIFIVIEVSSLQQMNDIISKLLKIEGVLNVHRGATN